MKGKSLHSRLQEYFPRARIVPATGSAAENREYIIKDGDFYEWGVMPIDQK
jgi:hypothetical protein